MDASARRRSQICSNDVAHVYYEDLIRSAEEELTRIVKQLTGKKISAERAGKICEAFSFTRQAQANKRTKNSFLRKGIVGDWRNHFSREACAVFDRYAGEALIRLGYEKDRNWVNHSDFS